MASDMRVLHVSEAMGGGIVTSIMAMLEATPGVDHHVALWDRRSHKDTGDDWATAFSSVTELPSNPFRAVAALRRAVRELFPDVVHAHSTYAGALTRVAGLDSAHLVYSPHCFAGLRLNASTPQRRGADFLERMLAPRTGLLVGVSPHELEVAGDLGYQHLAYVPNRALERPSAIASFRPRPLIVTTGRIAPQKDWRYLLHVKRYAEAELQVDADWCWLGGGDADGEAALRENGVEVTGWIPREELRRRLGRAQIYLHCAAWEGAPISVFEAAAAGLPLALRSIAPIASLDIPGSCESAVQLAIRLRELGDQGTWTAAQQASLQLATEHSASAQALGLYGAYEQITGVSVGPRALAPVFVPTSTGTPA